jgi:hypothetical protein
MIQSLTKTELISELHGYDTELKIVTGVSYGDRINTMQAIPATNVNECFIQQSDYSDSNYALKEDGDQDEEAELVISLNAEDDYSMDNAFNIEQLLEEILGGYEDLLITMGANYGDRVNTIQAIELTDLQEVYITQCEYSLSGYKIVEDGDQDDDSEKVLMLNYSAL